MPPIAYRIADYGHLRSGLHQRIVPASLCMRHIAQAKGGWMCPAAKSRRHTQSCDAHTPKLEITSSSSSFLPSSLSLPWCSSFGERSSSQKEPIRTKSVPRVRGNPQRLQHTQVIGIRYLSDRPAGSLLPDRIYGLSKEATSRRARVVNCESFLHLIFDRIGGGRDLLFDRSLL